MNQPLAYVDPGAKVASNVVVEPFATIHKNVVIEKGSWIGSGVTIMEGARIGKNVRIFPGTVVSAPPQDIKFDPDEMTECIIKDNVVLREHVTVHRGTNATGRTTVDEGAFLMVGSHVAHDCYIGKNAILVNNVAVGGHCEVGEYAILGGLAAMHQFTKVGTHCMIGGGALVRKDVPPYAKAGREPVQFVGINSIGLRRRGFDPDKIKEIQNIYRAIYQSGMNTTQAIDLLEAEFPVSDERDEIISFCRNSKRGIMRGYQTS